MKKTLRPLAAAILVAGIVLLASAGLLKTIDDTQRSLIASHIQANLESVVELIQLIAVDDINRVSVIATTPQLVDLAADSIAHPDDAKTHESLRAWLIPLYRGRGFVGFSLISPDHRVIDASSPAYVGKKVMTAGTLWAIQQADIDGAAISSPIKAPLPVANDGVTFPAGTQYQQACARIEKNKQRIGFLCLRSDPTQRLFGVLRASRTGETGEAYLVDAQGQILSPSRFRDQTNLQARVPRFERRDSQNQTVWGELTNVTAHLLKNKNSSTGYLENYPDYRGISVVGAGQWLPAIDMGVIVEEDVAEVFFANRVTHIAIVVLDGVVISAITVLALVQHRSRRRLARSEQLLNTVLTNVEAYVYLKDINGRYLYVNHKVEALYALSKNEILGRSDLELLPEKVARSFMRVDKEVLTTGIKRALDEDVIDSQGNVLRCWTIKIPIRLPGQEVAMLGISSDITELWQLQQELEARVDARTKDLQEARRLAETAADAKASFLANMSHEIRTPMNAIIGMSYLALQCDLNAQARNYLEKIQYAGQHLLGIINAILDYSKIDAGKFKISPAPFSLKQMIDTAISMVQPKAQAKQLLLNVVIADDVPNAVIGDALRIGQILTNFLSNAVKFTDRGTVTLRARKINSDAQDDDRIVVQFAVEDTGIGIEPETLALLFQPFFQAEVSATRRFEGTGLGLAISKRIAKLLGGWVSAQSELGKGSIFIVDVPLQIDHADTEHDSAHDDNLIGSLAHKTESHAALHGLQVLLVEDNEINQEVACDLLNAFGVEMTVADNGVAALEKMRTKNFDLILLDIQMPILDGYRTAQAIRGDATLAQPPIIAMTANALHGDRERCIAAGMNDYIAKPIEPALLLATIQRWAPGRADLKEKVAAASSIGLDYTALQKLGFDTDKALALLMQRETLYARVLRRFVDERADIPQQLNGALEEGDYDSAAMIVHSLKSLAGTMGAERLQTLCNELEQHMHARTPVPDLCAQFAAEMQHLIAGLTPVLADIGAQTS